MHSNRKEIAFSDKENFSLDGLDCFMFSVHGSWAQPNSYFKLQKGEKFVMVWGTKSSFRLFDLFEFTRCINFEDHWTVLDQNEKDFAWSTVENNFIF